ncbi:hypothetical protein [Clostridium sp. YIM B02506]|uniref:hypothetical protein n=1 Tax=Clostridium sp. YIM B02506 TaxID=2910680 RepID=UPI001EEE96FC|nr:hypothetical protein [Clostridium sp. YIM B02506]
MKMKIEYFIIILFIRGIVINIDTINISIKEMHTVPSVLAVTITIILIKLLKFINKFRKDKE